MSKKKNYKNNRLFYALGTITMILLTILLIVNITKNKDNEENNAKDVEGTEKVGQYAQLLEDGTKVNISEALNQEKECNGFKIYNIQLSSKNDITNLVADITNNTGRDLDDMTTVNITFLTQTGFEIITIQAQIKPLKQGETTQLNANVSFDYSDVYDFKVSF